MREPILRSAPLGGESEPAFFAFFTLRFRKHTLFNGAESERCWASHSKLVFTYCVPSVKRRSLEFRE